MPRQSSVTSIRGGASTIQTIAINFCLFLSFNFIDKMYCAEGFECVG